MSADLHHVVAAADEFVVAVVAQAHVVAGAVWLVRIARRLTEVTWRHGRPADEELSDHAGAGFATIFGDGPYTVAAARAPDRHGRVAIAQLADVEPRADVRLGRAVEVEQAHVRPPRSQPSYLIDRKRLAGEDHRAHRQLRYLE